MALQLADRTIKHPYGIIEDVLVKVDKFLFPVDFVVMDMEEDNEVPLILGRPFMKTAIVMIDVDDGKLTVRVQDDEVQFNVFKAMKHSKDKVECFRMDVLDEVISDSRKYTQRKDRLEKTLTEVFEEKSEVEAKNNSECLQQLNAFREIPYHQSFFQKIKEKKPKEATIEMKPLPLHLKCVFLAGDSQKPIIINSNVSKEEEKRLVKILQDYIGAIGWTLSDLTSISPSYCMHRILMEEDYKLVAQPQRHLNPTMKEVVRKEVVKLLEVGMIYPIFDSQWVSPIQVIPKMS